MKYGCDLMPQQRGFIDSKLYTWYELMRRRSVTGIILDPKGGDEGSVSPGVEKSLRTVHRERDDDDDVKHSSRDRPDTVRKVGRG